MLVFLLKQHVIILNIISERMKNETKHSCCLTILNVRWEIKILIQEIVLNFSKLNQI